MSAGSNSPLLDEEQVRQVGLLARLELTEDEVQYYRSSLSAILAHVRSLDELDTTNVQPTSHPLRLVNVFREDVVRPSLSNEAALQNAPDSEDGCFKVPAVIQED
jgi:aspartyl-tRNA(Asn)/glutamyl-tRNA(Gln) amidotransferase subunit C